MTIIQSAKAFARRAFKALTGYGKGTPPTQRASPVRYLHESTTLQPVPKELRALFNGASHFIVGKGHTYHSANAEVKKAADAIATEAGMNNKLRRRLRSKMVRRLHELEGRAA